MMRFLELVGVTWTIMLADVVCEKTTDTIKLEGTLSDHDVMIGSDVNLTCQGILTPLTTCSAIWYKNSKYVNEKKNNVRIKLLLGKRISKTQCSVPKLMIKSFTASDAGTYKCSAVENWARISQTNTEYISIDIYAVTCYQGFYCPKTQTKTVPNRCPIGTFSLYKNATTLKDCLPCPTSSNEREKWRENMALKKIAMFETNCPRGTPIQEKTSNLSPGAKVAIIVFPSLATLALFMGVLYAFHKKKVAMNYRTKLLSPFTDVDYDPPKVSRSKDVFVCYSSKNRYWVHEILFPKLKSQHFKVFIDFEDFEIGKTIDDNIVKGIYESRKTLFILSKDSLKSLYARKEIYHALAAGKTGHQVLVILYEKCKAPAEIANIVYLDWTDEKNKNRFWERLYSAIRKPLPNELVPV